MIQAATGKSPWLLRVHHRLRSLSFAMLFVAAVLHGYDKELGAGVWGFLVLLFLVYPHWQYWRASRSRDAIQAELQSLLFDSLLLGMAAAALHFSLWISFSAAVGTLVNNAANKGWRGVLQTIPACALGALAWVALFGLHFSPHTGAVATAFCMAALTMYLLIMNNIGFVRNQQLRRVRHQLQEREAALLEVNTRLLGNLREIDGLQNQLREQANRDPLTGLYNRRYLSSTLERELSRCKREGQVLSLWLIDIDHFKAINDVHGHQVGDAVLVQLARMLAAFARTEDVVCRFGGEEFLITMPTMPLQAAIERAEQLRSQVAQSPFVSGALDLKISISIGVSVYPMHGLLVDGLIGAADSALYRAKAAGRNQVFSAVSM